MTVTKFSEDQWRRIFTPSLTAALNKSKIAKTFPRYVLYGPASFHGLNITNPYFNQAISHLIVLIQESISHSQSGKVLQATAEAFQLELGLPFVTGITNVTPVKAYTTKSWYRHVAISIYHLPITITEDFPDVPLLCQNDSYIMMEFINTGYKNKDIYQLNI